MDDEDEAQFDESPPEPKRENRENQEERNARAEIKRSIREDNLDWAFTLAQINEKHLSEDTRVKICKMLHYSCSLLRRRRTDLEQLRAVLLALHLGVYRKMTDPHY